MKQLAAALETQVTNLTTRIYYGAGATPFGIKDTAFNYFVLIYYNQVLGLDAFLSGLALAIAVAIDALSDIAVGYLSDRWRSKLGRRHPFMYAAVLPVAISFYALWNPPEALTAETWPLFCYLVVMAVTVRSCLTFFEVPNSALGPELTNHYNDRTRLMSYRYLFGWIGGLCTAVLTFMVLLPGDAAGQLGPSGYQQLGMVGACSMLIMMILSAAGTHRHIPSLHVPESQATFKFRTLFEQIWAMFKNRSFVAVFVSALFFGAAAGLSQAISIYISTFFWHLNSTEIGFIPLLGLIAVPFAFAMSPKMAARWGKKAAAMRCFLFAIVFLPIAFLAQIVGFFPERESLFYLPLLMTHYLIETSAIICMQIIFASMNADVVEDRSAETNGRRDEGLIFAARNFAKKAVSGLGVLLAGVILWLADFPEKALPGELAPEAATTLVLIYLPALIFLYLASYQALQRYNIDHAKHLKNLAKQPA
jgi:Na+/melibiose symporter-like transporter